MATTLHTFHGKLIACRRCRVHEPFVPLVSFWLFPRTNCTFSNMDSTDTGEMIVKRVSVPIGLEELMEGLVKEVLLKKPDDMYFFAAKYFSQLLILRDKGQTKVKTIRSAQSLTDQREKRFQTKIPVSGVTKQLSRQFSIRGEAPVRNFDSPIVSQKPKMHDRNESKYKRRNTGPPTIPENHMNIVVRKKYSRSVSTERKRETGHSVSSTKKSTNRKETKDMQDETSGKTVINKTADKKNSATKEIQKNINLMKNKPTDQVVQNVLEQRNISERNETVGESKSVEVDSNKQIQQVSTENRQASNDDLAVLSEKTAAPLESSNMENSKGEIEDGKDTSKENVLEAADAIENDGSTDISINNGIEGIKNRNDDDEENKIEPIDDVDKSQTMEHLSEVNVKNSDEILKLDTSSEKSKSPSGTLDNLTMESENAEISVNKESPSISVNSYENNKDTTNNSASTDASKLAYHELNGVEEDSKAVEEENGEHVAEVTTNESDKTEEALRDKKVVVTEISSKEESDNNKNIPFLKNTIGEMGGNLKTEPKSEQTLLESIPTKHTETDGTDNDFVPSNDSGISDEMKGDSSHRNKMNEANAKPEQRGDSVDQEICEENHHENIIEKKVVDDVTEEADNNKEGQDEVDDSHHISVDAVQEKTTETPSEHEVMSSEISLQNPIAKHDSDEDTANKVALDRREKRGINEVSGKGTSNSSSEKEIIRTIPKDVVDMKSDLEKNHDVVINKKLNSTDHSKGESIESLEKPLNKSPMEYEADARDNRTSEIIIGKHSSNEDNQEERKDHEPDDQKLTEEQSNIEEAPKETPDPLADKDHDELMTNEAEDVSETDKPLEEPTEISQNRTDKAENDSVSKNEPVEGEKLTKELSEDNTENREEKDISDTNSTTGRESVNNAGNESTSRNESAENGERIKNDSSKDHETFDYEKTPHMSENKSYKDSNDKFTVPASSNDPGDGQTGSKTVKVISNITEKSKLGNEDKKSYNDENKVESPHETEKLTRNMSDEIEKEGKSDPQELKEHQDEQSTSSKELVNIDQETTTREQSEAKDNGNDTNEDILIRKEDIIDTNTSGKNEFSANTSKEMEEEEIDEKGEKEEPPTNYKNQKSIDSEKSELNETKTDHNNAIQGDVILSEVTENIVIPKEVGKLTNSNIVSTMNREEVDKNIYNFADKTNKKEDNTLSKTKDEHDHIPAIDSIGPEQNLKLEHPTLEQGIDSHEDFANILNDQNKNERNKRSLEQENEVSKNTQDFDTETSFKSEHESSSESKKTEEENNTETNSEDLKLNHENEEIDVPQGDVGRNLINESVDGIDSKEVTDIMASNEKQENTKVEIIDKVAKNYISYVIDNENYLKYNHVDNDRKEDDTANITDDISDDKNSCKPQDELDENSVIQKKNTNSPTSFDRLKLREELGIPSMEEPNDSEREDLKKNISSTLSIAKTGLIDIPVKKFINNFISNERDKHADNDDYKMEQSTKVESIQSFDRSKLREELQKIEHETKLTSFKQSFNSSLLRKELEHAALLKKSTKSNGYSNTLAKASAVVRIQSMWRGFIVRKSFPKPHYNEEFSVHRDENSNVYQKKNQEPVESKQNTVSVEDKGNNEDPKLMQAVTTIQRCWRGFKVRKHLNSSRMRQNSSGSARIKRHVDDKNIDFFDTMMAAVKIQKIWRGFITRKKLNITKKIGQACENEEVVDGTNGELIQNEKPMVNTEHAHTNEESIYKNGIIVKQIENHIVPLMKNDNNGNDEGSKSVPGSESNLHEKVKMGENLKAKSTSNFSDPKSNEEEKKIIDYATKIQSLWRGFLVRKYVKQLKKQIENKNDGHTHVTDEGEYPKEESQRPTSIDSNDSSNTVIFNDINKKSEEGVKPHEDHLLSYTMNHRDFDDVDASLDEILEYPLIKDEHLIDDYQNELLDRISGKQKDPGNDPEKLVGAVSSKRVEEIKAEDLKDIGAVHTSLLSSVGQDKNESQVEQIHPSRSKLESVIEESPSPTAEDLIDLKNEQAKEIPTTTTINSETEKSKVAFCSEPSAAPCQTKLIDGKPLSDYVEEIESLSSSENSKIGQTEEDDDVFEHAHPAVKHAAEKAQPSDFENVKLLHSGEWHDTIVVPLPKVVTESLKNDTEKGKIGHFQESEASEKSLDSTADLSSILSNASAGLLHTGEMHDGIVVPISLSSLGRSVSSGGENIGIDTVDSHTQAVQNSGVHTSDNTTNSGVSSVAVRVLQAPEPQVLTSPTPITDAGDVTLSDEPRSAQTPRKEDLRIQSQLSPLVGQSMESAANGKAEEKNMEAQAATKIQAGFRGYQVRKQLKLKVKHFKREVLEMVLLEHLHVKLHQQVPKIKTCLLHLLRQQELISIIAQTNGSSDMNPPKRQCRGKYQGRSDSAKSQNNRPKDVEEKSAVKIQAGVRGFLVRRRQKKQSNQES